MTKTNRSLVIAGGLLAKSGCLWAADALPRPDAPFKGKIDPSRDKSTPDWPQRHAASKGAPNVILILLDDVGFGATSTFGGPVATPFLSQLAASGLRYNRFHVNAMCSPTRGTLLSGRREAKVYFNTDAGSHAGQLGPPVGSAGTANGKSLQFLRCAIRARTGRGGTVSEDAESALESPFSNVSMLEPFGTRLW